MIRFLTILVGTYITFSLIILVVGTVYSSFTLLVETDMIDENELLCFLKRTEDGYKFSIRKAIKESFTWYKYVTLIAKEVLKLIEW